MATISGIDTRIANTMLSLRKPRTAASALSSEMRIDTTPSGVPAGT